MSDELTYIQKDEIKNIIKEYIRERTDPLEEKWDNRLKRYINHRIKKKMNFYKIGKVFKILLYCASTANIFAKPLVTSQLLIETIGTFIVANCLEEIFLILDSELYD